MLINTKEVQYHISEAGCGFIYIYFEFGRYVGSHKYKIYIHIISGLKYRVFICLKMASTAETCSTH